MSQSSALPIPGTTARAKRTKQALLRAAEAVFGAKGFERTSITDITQGAGVAQGTFYLHFADKRAVFLALVDELGVELRAALRAATRDASDRLEMEREGFRAFFRFIRERPDLYRIVRQAEFVDEAAYRAYYEKLAAGYMRGLRRAMDAGELRCVDVETLAWSLMGVADFLGLRFVLWGEEVDLDTLTASAVDLLRAGIARPTTAPVPVRHEGGKPT